MKKKTINEKITALIDEAQALKFKKFSARDRARNGAVTYLSVAQTFAQNL